MRPFLADLLEEYVLITSCAIMRLLPPVVLNHPEIAMTTGAMTTCNIN